MLLDKGADVNSQGGRFGNALQIASYEGHKEVVQMLLDKGADVNSEDKRGRSALSWAAEYGHNNVLETLLGSQTKVITANRAECKTPICSLKNRQVRGLYEKTLEPLARSSEEDAAISGMPVFNVYTKTKDINGTTPLLWATRGGHKDAVSLLLLQANVDPDSCDNKGRTALSWAARKGYVDIVRLLLDSEKVDVDSQDRDGYTPLMWALRRSHLSVVKLLLQGGSCMPDTCRVELAFQAFILALEDELNELLADAGNSDDHDILGLQSLFSNSYDS